MHPLYYDYPEVESAYAALTIDGKSTQYMLGNDLMVAPIVKARDSTNSMVNGVSIWLPPNSQWFEYESGLLLSGN